MKKLLIGVAMVMFAVMIATPAQATTVAEMLEMIEDLQVRVATLEAQVGSFDLTQVQADLDAVEAGLINLDADTSNVQLLNPFLTVTAATLNGVAGPNAVLTALNLHLVNGSGVTYGAGAPFAGHGNLILGYNEIPGTLPGPVPPIVGRTGSHCLVLGTENQWVSDASYIGGARNVIGAPFSFIATGPLSATTAPLQALP